MRQYISLFILMVFLISGCASSSASSPTPAATNQSVTTPQASTTVPSAATQLPTSNIAGLQLPPGFQISIYERDLNTPRMMTMASNGVLLVANRGAGSVAAIFPGPSPLTAAKMTTIVSGLHD